MVESTPDGGYTRWRIHIVEGTHSVHTIEGIHDGMYT